MTENSKRRVLTISSNDGEKAVLDGVSKARIFDRSGIEVTSLAERAAIQERLFLPLPEMFYHSWQLEEEAPLTAPSNFAENTDDITQIGHMTKASANCPHRIVLIGKTTDQNGKEQFHYTTKTSVHFGTWNESEQVLDRLNKEGPYRKDFGQAAFPKGKYADKDQLGMIAKNKKYIMIKHRKHHDNEMVHGEAYQLCYAHYLKTAKGNVQNHHYRHCKKANLLPFWVSDHAIA